MQAEQTLFVGSSVAEHSLIFLCYWVKTQLLLELSLEIKSYLFLDLYLTLHLAREAGLQYGIYFVGHLLQYTQQELFDWEDNESSPQCPIHILF